jgi:2,3-bisphosphoglycerate-dependent phosphoglycerate mutase
MQLYYIRHGESTNNRLYRETGGEIGRAHDPELTAIGVRQAEQVANFLARTPPRVETDRFDTQNRNGFRLTHVYTSLMMRAVSTGAVIAGRLGLPLHAWVDLHEEGGLFTTDEATGERVGQPGYGRPYFTEKYPALVLPETLGDEGWWRQGFEAAEVRTARAQRVLGELLERHGGTDDRVAFISHGGFYNHLLAAVFGLAAPLPVGHLLNNCALSRLAFPREGSPLILYQNRLDYLPDELVTH